MSVELTAAARILARQQSLITTAQAEGVDVNRKRCQRLVDRGVWERPETGVFGPAGVPLTWQRRLMVALLLAPPGSLASHRCAAALLEVGGIAAPMDLGCVVPSERYRQAMRGLRSKHGVRFDALLRTYLRHKRSGRNGGGALRDWLDRYVDTGGVAESELEQLALDAFLDAGLPPVCQLWVEVSGSTRYRLDLAFPALMLAVEVNGSQHEERPAQAADAIRKAALEALGWTVLTIRSKTCATDLVRAIDAVRRASVVVP